MKRETILWIVLAALVTILVMTMFRCNPGVKDYSKQYHDLQDSLRQQLSEDRDYWRGKYDSVLVIANKRDTMLIRDYRTNTIKYEKIPTTVNSLNDDELRRAFAEWQ